VIRTLLQPLRTIYDRALFHVGRRVRNRHVLAAVRRHAPLGGRVLDAGCGGGSLALAVARRHRRLEVEGIEMAPDKVAAGQAAGRKLKLENLRFEVGDITRIDRPARYDLAVSVDVLEHVLDDRAALRALAECLRPAGLLILHVPRAAPRRFFSILDDHHQEDHVRDGYDPQALAGQLREAGFAEVEVRHTFGAAGELAWELMQLTRRGRPSRARELAAIVLSPLLALLCELDFRLGAGERGNGLLVLARRPPDGARSNAARADVTRPHAAPPDAARPPRNVAQHSAIVH